MATYTGSDKRLGYLFTNGGGGGGSSTLAGLSDVDLTSPSDGQVLKYDANAQEWINANESGGGTGGGSFACDLLVENTNLTPSGTSNVNKEFTLSRSIENYDCVLVMALGYVNSTLQEQIGTLLIPKADYYKRAVGESGDTAIRWAFDIDLSVPTGRRTLAFGFYDSTHIYTASRNSESGVEPMLYKVYGMNFGGSLHAYSATEQVVGTWIDGKPIYEVSFSQVITGMASGSQYQILDLTANAIDNVIKIDGGYWYETNNTADKRYVAQGQYCSLEYAENGCILYGRQSFTSATASRTYTWIGTIQYTKSTD